MKDNDQDQFQSMLNLSSKNITDENNIFKELISSYNNIIHLDISNNQLTTIPEDLSALSKLQSLDIRGNPFRNVININIIFYLKKL